MKAVIVESGRELAGCVHVADSLFARMKGLLGKHSLAPNEALWIKPCNAIHTVGMKFAIDVVFLNADDRVVAVKTDLRQNRLTRIYPHAVSVLELKAGTVASTGLAIDNTITFV